MSRVKRITVQHCTRKVIQNGESKRQVVSNEKLVTNQLSVVYRQYAVNINNHGRLGCTTKDYKEYRKISTDLS